MEARKLASQKSNFDGVFWTRMFKSLLREPKIEIDYEKYLFQIETKNGAVFEFTVTNEFNLKSFQNDLSIKRESISRIDKYGNASWCIQNDYPDLRKFCVCK